MFDDRLRTYFGVRYIVSASNNPFKTALYTGRRCVQAVLVMPMWDSRINVALAHIPTAIQPQTLLLGLRRCHVHAPLDRDGLQRQRDLLLLGLINQEVLIQKGGIILRRSLAASVFLGLDGRLCKHFQRDRSPVSEKPLNVIVLRQTLGFDMLVFYVLLNLLSRHLAGQSLSGLCMPGCNRNDVSWQNLLLDAGRKRSNHECWLLQAIGSFLNDLFWSVFCSADVFNACICELESGAFEPLSSRV